MGEEQLSYDISPHPQDFSNLGSYVVQNSELLEFGAHDRVYILVIA